LGRELAGWVRSEGSNQIAFMDDTMNAGMFVDDVPVAGKISMFSLNPDDGVIFAISNSAARELLVNRLGDHVRHVSFIHRSAMFARADIGMGTMMFPFSVASVGSKIGKHCIVNVHSSIGHDVELGNFCTLSSHVDLCGHVFVGDRVFFGSGARVMPGVHIGNDAQIGAGAVVMRDVPDGATMFGVPAAKMK
jgi:sugar O-acyltransferase (sialic acid O-acetyltransferase NeuD family)